MMKYIRAGLLSLTLLAGSAVIDFAAASTARGNIQNNVTLRATDFSARSRSRPHTVYVHRAYAAPRYYDRPVYYVPAPFVPFNFGYPLLPPPWW
jgi:hypothetical protein